MQFFNTNLARKALLFNNIFFFLWNYLVSNLYSIEILCSIVLQQLVWFITIIIFFSNFALILSLSTFYSSPTLFLFLPYITFTLSLHYFYYSLVPVLLILPLYDFILNLCSFYSSSVFFISFLIPLSSFFPSKF